MRTIKAKIQEIQVNCVLSITFLYRLVVKKITQGYWFCISHLGLRKYNRKKSTILCLHRDILYIIESNSLRVTPYCDHYQREVFFLQFTYLFFLNVLRLSLSLVVSLSGSFLERPDLRMPYISGFSSHSRLISCLLLSFVSVLWFELLLWKLSLCALGASDFSDFPVSEPDSEPEPDPLDELESLH